MDNPTKNQGERLHVEAEWHGVHGLVEMRHDAATTHHVSECNKTFSLNLILSCTEDSTRRERDIDLTWIPVTIAELQDQIQEQFNIPVFDQKLTFGHTVLSGKESLQSYSLRNGDNITVEYSSEADVRDIVRVISYLQKTLAFLESLQPQLFLFPISPELQAQIQQDIHVYVTELEVFPNIYLSASPKKRIADARFYIYCGGLSLVQRLHSELLRYPFKMMPLPIQLIEVQLNRSLWALSFSRETEAAMLKELKWDNIVRSLLRATVLPNSAIRLPKNPYLQHQFDEQIQVQIIRDLQAATTGCLNCLLDDTSKMQCDLAANQMFLEQTLAMLQNRTEPSFRPCLLAIGLLIGLAYNPDTHHYLHKPHVIQAIIRTWKNAEPTPENSNINTTPAESAYLKYLAAELMSLLCSTIKKYSPQYLQVLNLMESFLRSIDYEQLFKYKVELGYECYTNLPLLGVAYIPYHSRKSVLACGSDPRYRALQMMCVETCVLSLQVILSGEGERRVMLEQGWLDYVICLPSVLPAKSRAQQRAKDLVAMLGKEMNLQPPSLNTMARARLAVTHFGLDTVRKSSAHELLTVVYESS